MINTPIVDTNVFALLVDIFGSYILLKASTNVFPIKFAETFKSFGITLRKASPALPKNFHVPNENFAMLSVVSP